MEFGEEAGPDCPSSDTLLGFVEGRLSETGGARVKSHMATCDDCLRLVAEAAKYVLADNSGAVTQPLDKLGSTDGGVASPVPSLLAAGTTVGRYVVAHPIGAGGMGVVYAAFDPGIGRRVALKLVRLDRSEVGSRSQTRLLREARAMGRLSHPNVVAVHDVGTFGEQVFVAMQLVEGTTLGRWLEERPRTWREALDVLMQAGRGLAAAHAAGVVHLDFKPANVLVGVDGRARVTDFGIARATDAPRESNAEAATPAARAAGDDAQRAAVTRGTSIAGTPAFMAPEQFVGEPTDVRTDQFSFSVALFRALYHEPPFEGRSTMEIADRVLSGAPRAFPAQTDVPRWLGDIVLRGLERSPERRFPTLDEMLAAITTELLASSAQLRAHRPRRALIAAGALAVALALAAIVAVSIASSRPGATRSPPARRRGAPHVTSSTATPRAEADVEVESVELVLRVRPESARVQVDGVATAERTLRVARSSLHRIDVTEAGYRPQVRLVRAEASGEVVVALSRASRARGSARRTPVKPYVGPVERF